MHVPGQSKPAYVGTQEWLGRVQLAVLRLRLVDTKYSCFYMITSIHVQVQYAQSNLAANNKRQSTRTALLPAGAPLEAAQVHVR